MIPFPLNLYLYIPTAPSVPIAVEIIVLIMVSIRKKRLAGKKLDKHEQQFYAENRAIVDLKRNETKAEAELFEQWIN